MRGIECKYFQPPPPPLGVLDRDIGLQKSLTSTIRSVSLATRPPTTEDEAPSSPPKTRALRLQLPRLSWSSKSNKQDEARKWGENFDELLHSSRGRTLFHQFLRSEYGEESLDFWESVEEFRRLKSSRLSARARELYEEYITVRAPRELNLDKDIRSRIEEGLEHVTPDLFDAAQTRVKWLMEREPYTRFIYSPFYMEVVPTTDKRMKRKRASH
ncbi:unnamed protein product [Cyprideis torosa]|uniref:Uncharacterized protein n=1 Tax=Cyprideis torosa TaxID=163714 RepID=A0A7R8W9E2_9CRUS|nr:unnamed protein product [Cyprideis torosa]CAG0889715.1 unnamed protein product [Cyprideis torosa]